MTTRIALLGDESAHRSHRELNALRPSLAVETVWVPTDSGTDLAAYDGIWLVPGSPYADEAAVLHAIALAREQQIAFLGTCSGLQYAVIEFARHVLDEAATHAESDGAGDDNAVAALACSLYGVERLVTPVPGTRFAGLVEAPFMGMHFCNYGPTSAVVGRLVTAGVVVGATADDAGAEVLEFPDHPFFVASLFQPHVGALDGGPVHPLIGAFVAAAGPHG